MRHSKSEPRKSQWNWTMLSCTVHPATFGCPFHPCLFSFCTMSWPRLGKHIANVNLATRQPNVFTPFLFFIFLISHGRGWKEQCWIQWIFIYVNHHVLQLHFNRWNRSWFDNEFENVKIVHVEALKIIKKMKWIIRSLFDVSRSPIWPGRRRSFDPRVHLIRPSWPWPNGAIYFIRSPQLKF